MFNHRAETLSLVSEGRTGAARLDANDHMYSTDTARTATRQKKSAVSALFEPNTQTYQPVRSRLA